MSSYYDYPDNNRVGRIEREGALVRLRKATGTEHLSLEEFTPRMERVMEAKTRGELDRIVGDLPALPKRWYRRWRWGRIGWCASLLASCLGFLPGLLTGGYANHAPALQLSLAIAGTVFAVVGGFATLVFAFCWMFGEVEW